MAPLIRFPLKQYTSFVSASVTAAGADGRHSVGGCVKIPSIDYQGRSFMISAVVHKIFHKRTCQEKNRPTRRDRYVHTSTCHQGGERRTCAHRLRFRPE